MQKRLEAGEIKGTSLFPGPKKLGLRFVYNQQQRPNAEETRNVGKTTNKRDEG